MSTQPTTSLPSRLCSNLTFSRMLTLEPSLNSHISHPTLLFWHSPSLSPLYPFVSSFQRTYCLLTYLCTGLLFTVYLHPLKCKHHELKDLCQCCIPPATYKALSRYFCNEWMNGYSREDKSMYLYIYPAWYKAGCRNCCNRDKETARHSAVGAVKRSVPWHFRLSNYIHLDRCQAHLCSSPVASSGYVTKTHLVLQGSSTSTAGE